MSQDTRPTPDDGLLVVGFSVIGGREDGWCVVGTSTEAEATTIAQRELPRVDVSAMVADPHPRYRIDEVITLEEYASDHGVELDDSQRPPPGGFVLLDIGT